MEIERIEAYEVEVKFAVPWVWSAGRIDSYTTTIVRLQCANGIEGWGETCPFGSFYVAGYYGGVRPALRELAPALIGQSAIELDLINDRMDKAMAGHEFVKSAIDMACWDALGQVSGRPLCELLGGRFPGETRAVAGILLDTPENVLGDVERHRSDGKRVFSIKASGDAEQNIAIMNLLHEDRRVGEDIYIDANRGLTPAEAFRMLRAFPTGDFLYEQPCRTYDEVLTVRRHTSHPIMLDEVVVTTEDMLRAVSDRACDAINIKISRVGGLTKAKRIRDICLAADIRMSIQDTGGSDVVKAALAHFAQSVPSKHRLSTWDVDDIKSFNTFETDVVKHKGALEAGVKPGLGITPVWDCLGRPVEVFE